MQQSYLGNKEDLRKILASCVCGTVEIARKITNKKNGPQETRVCFNYITEKFNHISPAILKAGILDGPHIRKLLKDEIFITKMKKDGKVAWISFKNVVKSF